ncbi:MAG: hypothetical protein BalsKO_25460 [Balneolaceae bacterium]
MKSIDIHEKAEQINSKKDFEEFMELFYQDFKINGKSWENYDLVSYLEALRAYSKDIEGYYKNMNIPFDSEKPSWRNFAEILLGASVYE